MRFNSGKIKSDKTRGLSMLVIGSNSSAQTNTDTAFAVKTANLAKNQQSREGQMALELIQSANITNLATPAVNLSGSIGTQINIKV
jgi:hypothetical protein